MVWNTRREAFEAAGVLAGLTARHYWCAPATTTGIDASVAYTSGTTITISSLGWTFKRDNIVMILQIPVSTGTGTVIQHTDKSLFTVTGAVIAVEGAVFASSDTFQVVLVGEDVTEATLDAIETEILDQGTTLDGIETEVLDQGTTLDAIETDTGNIATSTGTTATNTGTTATNTGTSAGLLATIAGYLASIVNAYVSAITSLRAYIVNWPQPASGEAVLELTALAAATTRYIIDLDGYHSHTGQVHTVANVTWSVWFGNDASADTSADTGWAKDTDIGDQTGSLSWYRDEPWDRMMIKVISAGSGTLDLHTTRYP